MKPPDSVSLMWLNYYKNCQKISFKGWKKENIFNTFKYVAEKKNTIFPASSCISVSIVQCNRPALRLDRYIDR